jgi:Cu-Zn family superoxide dismutase
MVDAFHMRTPWMLAFTAALLLSACRMPYIPIPYITKPPPAGAAHLRDASGRAVGTAVLLQEGSEVRILLDVTGLPPGEKGVHLHEVGRCDPPAFESAGGHFNPTKAEHGTQNPRGPHGGDLPNITVDAKGNGHLEVTLKQVTLQKKGSTSLLDGDGSALVVHAERDDLRTDPAGTSGPRIACGVVVPAE